MCEVYSDLCLSKYDSCINFFVITSGCQELKIYEIILIWYITKTITNVSYYILLKKKEYLIIHVLYSYFLVITSGGPIIWKVLIGHITKAVTNVLLFIWIALDDILKILGYIYLGGFKGSLIIFLRFRYISIILEVYSVYWSFYRKIEKWEICSLKVENVLRP